MNVRTLMGYQIEGSILTLYVVNIDRFSKLLSLRGFDYVVLEKFGWPVIEIDPSDYFDLDRFMEIVDILNYSYFRWIPTTIVELNNDRAREELREEILAILV